MMNKDATLPEIAELRLMPDDMPCVPFERDPLREPIDAVLEGEWTSCAKTTNSANSAHFREVG
jgi:hypothetical protein